MFSINGIGTSLYGKNEIDSDGSYITTKWFIFFLLPIIPLGSYRVLRGETTASMSGLVGVPGATTQYKMISVPLNWKQVIQTYLLVYGILVLIVFDYMIFESNMYITKIGLILGFIYSIYYLFKTGKKWWAILLIISAVAIGFSILIY
ncbi:hypothetical protein KKC45_03525 [Patescibacteria group bacterium]|nr:hypothetical protein [Patescibacteria group bacterium]